MSGVTRQGVPGADVDARVSDLRRQLGQVLAALTTVEANGVAPAVEAAETLRNKELDHPPLLDELPALISVSKAATVLGISRASAYRYAACDDLPTVRLGGRLYVVTARLREFLEAA